MSNSTEKPKLGTRPPLGIKRTVETGKVKQSFSHGRSNTVVVEVKKRRILGRPGEEAPKPAPAAEAPAPEPVAKPAPAPAKPAAPKRAPADDIMSRRELQEKLLREAEEARMNSPRGSAPPRRSCRAHRDRRRKAPRRGQSQGRSRSARARSSPSPSPSPSRSKSPKRAAPSGKHEEKRFTHRPPSPVAPKRTEPGRPGRGGHEERRHAGKLTVTRALSGEDDNRARSLAALKRSREKEKRAHAQAGPSAKQVRDVVVPEAITIQELANRMAERGADLVKALFKMGSAVTLTQTIDQDTAELLVTEFGHNIKRVSESDVEIGIGDEADAPETLQTRPPVVTIMGHVDHGKTQLARRDPRRGRRRGRSRRHHPAYRRLSGGAARRRQDHLPRHAGPRGLHRNARARRQRHRHRHPGRRRRRRAEAADDRGDQPHQGGRRADDRRDQQDRQARRQSAEGPRGASPARDHRRGDGRRGPGRRSLGAQEDQPRRACSKRSRSRPKSSS